MIDDILITVEHIRLASQRNPRTFCVRGMREWFSLHNLDFDTFVRQGYSILVADAIDDKFAKEIAKIARELHAQKDKK